MVLESPPLAISGYFTPLLIMSKVVLNLTDNFVEILVSNDFPAGNKQFTEVIFLVGQK